MKLLLLTEYFPSSKDVDVHGGVEVRAYKIADFLSRKHEVVVFASREKNKPQYQKIGNVIIKRLGLPRKYSAFAKLTQAFTRIVFMAAIVWYGRWENFDAVEGNSHFVWFPAIVLARIKRKKAIALVADLADKSLSVYMSSISYIILQIFQFLILKFNWDLYVCISDTVKNKLISLGIEKFKIRKIYCGTDVKAIQNIKIVKKRLEIVCVSRLVSYKRVGDLIRAFSKVSMSIPRARLSIIGIGNEFNSLVNLSQKLHISNKVHFLGFLSRQSDVWKIIKSSFVFCLPSVIEGFGIVTVEALACQVPAVLADIPTNHEIAQNKGVLFFKPYDIPDLTRQLIRALSYKNLRDELIGETKSIVQLYDWRKIGAQTQKIYENLCIN